VSTTNYTLLSLEQTPPLRVPLRYFLTAPLFAAAAGVLLLIFPEGFGGRWTPLLLAVTHLLTLGYAGMVMFGALQQLLPVLAGVQVPHADRVSRTLHLLLSAGTILLAAGLLGNHPPTLLAAVAALALAAGGLIAVALLALRRSRSVHDSVRGMRHALVAFAVTALLGLYLAAGHGVAEVPLHRPLVTNLHLSWGLLGWIGLLVMAVGYQVVPMFQLTPNYPQRLSRLLTATLFSGLVIWSAGRLLGSDRTFSALLATAGATVILVALGSFVAATFVLQLKRRRRLPDVTLDYWRLGLLALALALMLWPVRAWWGGWVGAPEVLLGVLFIVGFTMSVISGMLYKIAPFLVWLHLNNWMQIGGHAQGRIPNMKQVIPERRARWQFRLHLAALVVLLLAAVRPGVLIYPAALLFLGTNLLLWWNLMQAARLYRKMVSAARAAGGGTG